MYHLICWLAAESCLGCSWQSTSTRSALEHRKTRSRKSLPSVTARLVSTRCS